MACCKCCHVKWGVLDDRLFIKERAIGWKKKEFTVDNAFFGNGIDKYDSVRGIDCIADGDGNVLYVMSNFDPESGPCILRPLLRGHRERRYGDDL